MRSARALFVLSAGVYAVVVLWSALALPERVPQHYGAEGTATAYTERSTWLVFLGGTGAGTAALFLGVVRLLRHPDRPWVNVPRPWYWKRPEHVEELRRLVTEDMWFFGACTFLLLDATFALTVPAARAPEPSVGPWAGVLLVAYLVVTLGRVVWMYARRYAVPDGAGR